MGEQHSFHCKTVSWSDLTVRVENLKSDTTSFMELIMPLKDLDSDVCTMKYHKHLNISNTWLVPKRSLCVSVSGVRIQADAGFSFLIFLAILVTSQLITI